MKKSPNKKVISQNDGNFNILKITKNNLTESEDVTTKINEYFTKERKTINIIPSAKKIVLFKAPKKEENNNIKNNPKNNLLIKRIANKLKKRINFPKCKIFKFYMTYRLLILRIAKGIKKKAKKFNFWEKWENNMTEKEINQIQEIASTACKIILEGGKKKINKKKISSSDRKRNIKINLSIFKKSDKKETSNLNINNKNINNNDNNYEIQNLITYLKNLNINENNTSNFIDEFSSFLIKNNIQICPDTKIPIFTNTNNMYLLNQKEFWIKYILFISNKYKDNLTIYTFIYFIEQFYIWNNSTLNDEFNNEIKNQINTLFNEEIINNFLITNKIKNLDQLFERYKNIHKNRNINKEIKIENNDCDCPTCKNNGFIDKIINYNKKNNKISLAKDNSISFIANKTNKNNLNKNNNSNKNYKKNKDKGKSSNNNNDTENEDIFKYLRKIEEGKKEQEKKKKNSSKKKRKKSKKRNKSNKNDKIQEIFDLLSIDGDIQSSNSSDSDDSFHKAVKKKTKNNRK